MTSPPASAVPIAITGVGLRTPIGTTALQTTTSVLAGLNRFREWPHLGLDLGEDGPGLPTASAIAGLGDATWQDKADALARPAVEEALHAARWFRASDLVNAHGREAVALYLAAPYPMDASVPDCEAGLDAVGDAIGDFVVGLGEIPSVADPVAHASGIRCIAAAMRDLHEQRIDVAIVCGLDSLLETEWLARGIVDRIVKLEDTAAGVVPGEGAGVLVLERHADAATRGVEPVALVGNLALADEPIRYDGAEPLEATALSEALHGILDHLEAGPGAIGDVLVDLNGERGRFQEWALAEGRCLHRLADGWRLHAPALSLGDLGAASGVVTVGIAALMLQRRRARGDAALVCSMSANGERACALVGAPRTKVQ